MDFGAGHDGRRGEATGLSGTPLYLAPELFAGHPPSIATDIYSIGVLLYYLLTRVHPVRGDTLKEAIDAAIARWMGWRIDRKTSRETGIPKGLPYLTGFANHYAIMAELPY